MQTKETQTNQNLAEIPEDFRCSITQEIMAEPVMLVETGHTYEREVILIHLQNKQTDPLTGLPLRDTRMQTNHMAKKLIASFLKKQLVSNPDIVNEVYLPNDWVLALITALNENAMRLFKETLEKDSRLLHKKLKDNKNIFALVCESGSLESLKIVVAKLGDKFKELEWVKAEEGLPPFLMASRRFGLDGANCIAKAMGWESSDEFLKQVDTEKKAEVAQLLSEAQFNLGCCYYYGEGVIKDLAQAVKYFQLAAAQGHVEALYRLGVCYYYGEGIAKDLTQAMKCYHQLAAQGALYPKGLLEGLFKDDPELKAQMTTSSQESFWASPNSSTSSIPTTTAATNITNITTYSTNTTPMNSQSDQENAVALYKLGHCYYHGYGVIKDPVQAVKYYQLAADQGHVVAQSNVGHCYYHGYGVIKDPVQAVKYYQLAADQGNVVAQSNVGHCYYHGYGVIKDPVQAVKYYQLAADQGNAKAQYHLGICYHRGEGVAKDLTQAMKYYQLAAAQGHTVAQASLEGVRKENPEFLSQMEKNAIALFKLGNQYDIGDGVTKDPAQAVQYYQLAADQGHREAQACLGVCYYHGNGVIKDLVQAVKYFQLAAFQGFAEAQVSLGNCYYDGAGVTRDLVKAVNYYHVAAIQGHVEAQANLDVLLNNNPELKAQIVTPSPVSFWTSPNSSASSAQSRGTVEAQSDTRSVPNEECVMM